MSKGWAGVCIGNRHGWLGFGCLLSISGCPSVLFACLVWSGLVWEVSLCSLMARFLCLIGTSEVCMGDGLGFGCLLSISGCPSVAQPAVQ